MLLALGQLGGEAQTALADTLADDVGQADERAAQDEQDVRRVDVDELLLGVLAPALRRHGGLGALDDLQKRLLHALARHVARDGEVLGLAGDLVDLVDVDDSDFRARDIEVGGGDQLEQDVLDVLADISRLGERRRIGDRERDAQRARKRLGKQRLAGARGAQEHDVALRELDVALLRLRFHADALVVVVDGDGEGALRVFLPHHMLGKLGVELVGCGQVAQDVGGVRRLVLDVGLDDLPAVLRATAAATTGGLLVGHAVEGGRKAQVAHHRVGAHRDALVADVDAVRARDHRGHLVG